MIYPIFRLKNIHWPVDKTHHHSSLLSSWDLPNAKCSNCVDLKITRPTVLISLCECRRPGYVSSTMSTPTNCNNTIFKWVTWSRTKDMPRTAKVGHRLGLANVDHNLGHVQCLCQAERLWKIVVAQTKWTSFGLGQIGT